VKFFSSEEKFWCYTPSESENTQLFNVDAEAEVSGMEKEDGMEAREWVDTGMSQEEVSPLQVAQNDAVKRVKKLIIEKSLTVSELSKRTGYSISYISMVINGRRKNGDVRDAIARALERNPQELWAGC